MNFSDPRVVDPALKIWPGVQIRSDVQNLIDRSKVCVSIKSPYGNQKSLRRYAYLPTKSCCGKHRLDNHCPMGIMLATTLKGGQHFLKFWKYLSTFSRKSYSPWSPPRSSLPLFAFPFNHPAEQCPFNHVADNYWFKHLSDNYPLNCPADSQPFSHPAN